MAEPNHVRSIAISILQGTFGDHDPPRHLFSILFYHFLFYSFLLYSILYYRELLETMTRLSILPADFEGKHKVNTWLKTLDEMQVGHRPSAQDLVHGFWSAWWYFTWYEIVWCSSPKIFAQASDELDDAQVRQLIFDLESSYNTFNRILHQNWKWCLWKTLEEKKLVMTRFLLSHHFILIRFIPICFYVYILWLHDMITFN